MRSQTSQGPLTVVFDVGGVLAAHPDGSRAVAEVLGCDPSAISEQYWAGREAFDLGASPEDYFAPLAAAAGLALDAPYAPPVVAPSAADEAEDAELARTLAEIDADDAEAEENTDPGDADPGDADPGDADRGVAEPDPGTDERARPGVRESAAAAGDSETVLDAMIAADNAYWSEIHPESRTLLHELSRRKVRLAILSNAPYVFVDRLREVDWIEAFEIVIASGEEGVAKPDREVYEILFEEVKNFTGGVAVPGNIVYFDDKQENVDAALAVGIDAHLWPANNAHHEGAPGWEIARAALAARGLDLE